MGAWWLIADVRVPAGAEDCPHWGGWSDITFNSRLTVELNVRGHKDKASTEAYRRKLSDLREKFLNQTHENHLCKRD